MMGRRTMVLLPGALALVLSALLSCVAAAESSAPRSDPAAAADPCPPVPDGEVRREACRVRAGDTLGAIARRQGVSLSTLRSVNGIGSDSHHIRTGQNLLIPAGGTENRRAAAKSVVKIRAAPGT